MPGKFVLKKTTDGGYHFVLKARKGETIAQSHSTITVTMNTYAHVAPALQREAAASLDRVFGSGSGA